MAFKKVRFATKTQEKILSPVDSASLSQCSSSETDNEDGMPRQHFSQALRIPPLDFEDTSHADLEHDARETHSSLPERPQPYNGVTCEAKEPVTVGLGILYSETNTETNEGETEQSLLSDPVWWTMPRWEFEDYSGAARVVEGVHSNQPGNDDTLEEEESLSRKPKDSIRSESSSAWRRNTMPFGPGRDQIIGSGYNSLGSSSSSSSSISSVPDSGCAIRSPTASEIDAEIASGGPLCGAEWALQAEQNRLRKIPAPLRYFFQIRWQLKLRQARQFKRLPVTAVQPASALNDNNDNGKTAEARDDNIPGPMEFSNSSSSSRDARAIQTSHSIQALVASEEPDNIDIESQEGLLRRCLTRKATFFWIVVFFCLAFAASWALVIGAGMLKFEKREEPKH